MTGRDGGIGQIVANGFNAAKNGVVSFTAERLDGRVPHLDHVLTVVNFEAGGGLGVAEFL
jgi:hypothetical protein